MTNLKGEQSNYIADKKQAFQQPCLITNIFINSLFTPPYDNGLLHNLRVKLHPLKKIRKVLKV